MATVSTRSPPRAYTPQFVARVRGDLCLCTYVCSLVYVTCSIGLLGSDFEFPKDMSIVVQKRDHILLDKQDTPFILENGITSYLSRVCYVGRPPHCMPGDITGQPAVHSCYV